MGHERRIVDGMCKTLLMSRPVIRQDKDILQTDWGPSICKCLIRPKQAENICPNSARNRWANSVPDLLECMQFARIEAEPIGIPMKACGFPGSYAARHKWV